MNTWLKENHIPRNALYAFSAPGRVLRFLSICKPGIVFGNLVNAAGGFFLAARGHIDIFLMVSTFVGISLVVASGCVFNNWIDRYIDREMVRTRNRILARGLMTNKTVVFYAAFLGIAGTVTLLATTNMLTVLIVLTGFAIYVGVYSLWLKRSSVHATLVGSLAGATPPLAGYCAVCGRFDLAALILLAVFSLWQIPHSYAIALYRLDDYAAAAIPVLPVKRGSHAVKRHIAFYILAFMAAAVMLTFTGITGNRYLATVVVLGGVWMAMTLAEGRLYDGRIWAKGLFLFSILMVVAVSVMMSIDFTVPAPLSMHQNLVH